MALEVLIFCGLQGAGKSTYYREHFALTHLLLSKDLMPGRGRKEHRQTELLHLALAAHHSVVIDNTNPTPLERAPLVTIAHAYGAVAIGLYFVAPLKLAIERNQQREGTARVPPVAIYRTAARLTPPTYAEGFDSIYYIQSAENSNQIAPRWSIEEISHG